MFKKMVPDFCFSLKNINSKVRRYELSDPAEKLATFATPHIQNVKNFCLNFGPFRIQIKSSKIP